MISINPEYTMKVSSCDYSSRGMRSLTSRKHPKVRIHPLVPTTPRQAWLPDFLDGIALEPHGDNVEPHEQVHRHDADPHRNLYPSICDTEQRHTERGLAPYGRKYGEGRDELRR